MLGSRRLRLSLDPWSNCPAADNPVADTPAVDTPAVDTPAVDNLAADNSVADISDGVRALTTRERGYIQTFPDSFLFPGAKTEVELAIGNAVPPVLAKYLATNIDLYDKQI